MSALLADVERWLAETFPPLSPRSGEPPVQLLNVRPTVEQLAEHPKSLAIQAYFAGARFAGGRLLQRFPRPLTEDEAQCWVEGWGEHQDEACLAAAAERDTAVLRSGRAA